MRELDHKRRLSLEEFMLNCGAGEGSWESLGLQGDLKPEYSLEGLTLKLKFQYFGHSCEELTH